MEPNAMKALETALADLATRKQTLDEANQTASAAAVAYDEAVVAARAAQERLQAHIDALMPGVASASRVRVA